MTDRRTAVLSRYVIVFIVIMLCGFVVMIGLSMLGVACPSNYETVPNNEIHELTHRLRSEAELRLANLHVDWPYYVNIGQLTQEHALATFVWASSTFPGDPLRRTGTIRVEAGWPIRCVFGEVLTGDVGIVPLQQQFRQSTPLSTTSVVTLAGYTFVVPLCVRPMQATLNALACAAMISIVYLAWTAYMLVVRRRRAASGKCVACSYAIGAFHRCPECGNPRA